MYSLEYSFESLKNCIIFPFLCNDRSLRKTDIISAKELLILYNSLIMNYTQHPLETHKTILVLQMRLLKQSKDPFLAGKFTPLLLILKMFLLVDELHKRLSNYPKFH